MNPRIAVELIQRYNADPRMFTDAEAEMVAQLAQALNLPFPRENKPIQKGLFDLADTMSFGAVPNQWRPMSRGQTAFGETGMDKFGGGLGTVAGIGGAAAGAILGAPMIGAAAGAGMRGAASLAGAGMRGAAAAGKTAQGFYRGARGLSTTGNAAKAGGAMAQRGQAAGRSLAAQLEALRNEMATRFYSRAYPMNAPGPFGGTGVSAPFGGSPLGLQHGGQAPKVRAGAQPPGSTDTVPAMLTPGEFVIKKDAVDKVGLDFLHKVNSSADQGFKHGGRVEYAKHHNLPAQEYKAKTQGYKKGGLATRSSSGIDEGGSIHSWGNEPEFRMRKPMRRRQMPIPRFQYGGRVYQGNPLMSAASKIDQGYGYASGGKVKKRTQPPRDIAFELAWGDEDWESINKK